MKQKTMFLEHGEADEWFLRNLGSLGKYDPVTPLIEELKIVPKYVLEVGCANGWRLNKLRDKFNCGVVGVEPSMKAGMDAARLKVPVHQMTANTLPVTSGGFDMIIYGFCLYLTDPEDWLNIAAEGDRALADGGHIVIHDFWDGHIGAGSAFAKPYDHRPGIAAYHFDFSQLWLMHPRYRVVKAMPGPHSDGVTIIQKRAVKDSIRIIP